MTDWVLINIFIIKWYDNRFFFIKFAITTFLLFLFGSESNYVQYLDKFINWCDKSYLYLKVDKVNDMIFDLRSKYNRNMSEDTKIQDELWVL